MSIVEKMDEEKNNQRRLPRGSHFAFLNSGPWRINKAGVHDLMVPILKSEWDH
jgi:hypothetical protein